MNKHPKSSTGKVNYNLTDTLSSQINPNDNSKYNKNNNHNINDKIN